MHHIARVLKSVKKNSLDFDILFQYLTTYNLENSCMSSKYDILHSCQMSRCLELAANEMRSTTFNATVICYGYY